MSPVRMDDQVTKLVHFKKNDDSLDDDDFLDSQDFIF